MKNILFSNRNFGKHVGPAADVNHWKNTYKSKYIIDQKQKS